MNLFRQLISKKKGRPFMEQPLSVKKRYQVKS